MQRIKEEAELICVLIGEVGSGKTTIFNKVCGTKHLADISFDSQTRGLALHHASFGEFPFHLIDTPGLGSIDDKLTHAVFLKHSLTYQKINAVFAIVQFEPRISKMIKQLKKIIETVP